MLRASQRGPKMKIDTVNPQSCAPPMKPTCSFVKMNFSFSGCMMSLTTAKDTEVARRAKQLAEKRRSGDSAVLFIVENLPKPLGIQKLLVGFPQ